MGKCTFVIAEQLPRGSDELARYGYYPARLQERLLTALKRHGRVCRPTELNGDEVGTLLGFAFDEDQARQLLEHAPTCLVLPGLEPALECPQGSLADQEHANPLFFASLSGCDCGDLTGGRGVARLRFLDWVRVHPMYPDIERDVRVDHLPIDFDCNAIDSHEFVRGSGLVRIPGFGHLYPEHGPALLPWDGSDLEIGYRSSNLSGIFLEGFYPPEPWGSWSRTDNPAVNLPYAVDGNLTLELKMQAYGANVGREITVHLGAQQATITLAREITSYMLDFDLGTPQSRLFFSTLDLTPVEGALDVRTMGIGLQTISISRQQDGSSDRPRSGLEPLQGYVYTTRLASTGQGSNAVDLITAFAQAFRDEAEANLLINIDGDSDVTDIMALATEVKRTLPFAGRIILLPGELSAEVWGRLIDASTFYVSLAALLPDPHLELTFLASGVPLVCARHATLEAFLASDNSFIVESSVEPLRLALNEGEPAYIEAHRLGWEQLVVALRKSLEAARSEDGYRAMRFSARESAEQQASNEALAEILESLLAITAEAGEDSAA